jgi:hypothetical protein
VTGTITTGKGKNKTTTVVEATITSWTDTRIEANFGSPPSDVTVYSVFGADTAAASKGRRKR